MTTAEWTTHPDCIVLFEPGLGWSVRVTRFLEGKSLDRFFFALRQAVGDKVGDFQPVELFLSWGSRTTTVRASWSEVRKPSRELMVKAETQDIEELQLRLQNNSPVRFRHRTRYERKINV